MTEIRAFRDADAPAIAALWETVFGYPEARNAPGLVLADKLAFQRDFLFVAAAEDRIVGTAMGGYDGHRGWLYRLAVAPDRRRRGIGEALTRAVIAALREAGCRKLNLQIAADAQGRDEKGLVAFYERQGFAVEPRISMGLSLFPGTGVTRM